MMDIPEIHDVQDQAGELGAPLTERELAMLAEAEAQIERGEFYDFDVVEAWLDGLEADPNAKLPSFSKR